MNKEIFFSESPFMVFPAWILLVEVEDRKKIKEAATEIHTKREEIEENREKRWEDEEEKATEKKQKDEEKSLEIKRQEEIALEEEAKHSEDELTKISLDLLKKKNKKCKKHTKINFF